MDEKAIRTLRKLIDAIPVNLREEGWRFDATNTGRTFNFCYGISNVGRGLTGIYVETANSFRQDSYLDEVTIDEKKLGNILAAFVATANPATIADLLDEIDALRNEVFVLTNQRGYITEAGEIISDLVEVCRELEDHLSKVAIFSNPRNPNQTSIALCEKARSAIVKAEDYMPVQYSLVSPAYSEDILVFTFDELVEFCEGAKPRCELRETTINDIKVVVDQTGELVGVDDNHMQDWFDGKLKVKVEGGAK